MTAAGGSEARTRRICEAGGVSVATSPGRVGVDAVSPRLAASYAHCHALTRRAAQSFYRGMTLTPEPKRSGLFAVYAWMRAADDAADGDGERTGGADRLAAFRERTAAVLDGPAPADGDDAFWPAFAEAVRRYAVPRAALDAQLAGQAADLAPRDVRDEAALRRYCDRVASSVGFCCVAVWGHDDDAGVPDLVRARGRALQRTNILRDVAEDAARGRTYVPADARARHGLGGDRWAAVVSGRPSTGAGENAPAAFGRLMAEQIAAARADYAASAKLERHLHPDGRAASWTLARSYRCLLERIARDPAAVIRGRVRLPPTAKMRVAAAGLLRYRRRHRGAAW